MAELSQFIINIGTNFNDDGAKKATGFFKGFVITLSDVKMIADKIWQSFQWFIKTATDSEKATSLLAEAMAQNGIYTKEAHQELVTYANDLMKKTTFTDEDIIATETKLTQYKIEKGLLKDLTPAILDLAQAKGMDLASATDLVGRAIFSEMTSIRGIGIELGNTTDKTEKTKIAIEKLTSVFGGTAQAYAGTFEGRLKQVKMQFDEMAETVALKMLPKLTEFITYIRDNLIPVFETMITSTSNSTTFFDVLGATFKWIIKAGIGVVATFDLVGTAIATATALITGHKKAFEEGQKEIEQKKIEYANLLLQLDKKILKSGKDIEDKRSKYLEQKSKENINTKTNEFQMTADQEQAYNVLRLNSTMQNNLDINNLQLAQAEQRRQISANMNNGIVEYELATNAERAQNMADTLNFIATLSTSHNKTVNTIGKVAAIASAIILTRLAAIRALASAPPPWGAILSGTVYAAGMVQVAAMKAQKFALGVRNFSGGWAEVGEQGRELVHLPKGSDVYSHSESQGMMGGNIYITVPPITSRKVAREYADVIGKEFYKKVGRSRRI